MEEKRDSVRHRERSADERRRRITEALEAADVPVSASSLAKELSVSRQIIVGDVAILRAAGCGILATPRGYIMDSHEASSFPFTGMIACRHSREQLRPELYTIVDFGATVIDVTIEHAIYGELSGKLNLSSRYDVDRFIEKVENEQNSAPISTLTGGAHLHRIGCRDESVFDMIKASLREQDILME